METVDRPVIPAPICAACGERIHTAWQVTNPPLVYVLCRRPTCTGWATSQGLSMYSTGVMPVRKAPRPGATLRPRRKPVPRCFACHGPLPQHKRDWFLMNHRPYCTLTCMQKNN